MTTPEPKHNHHHDQLTHLHQTGIITTREHQILQLRHTHQLSQNTVARALGVTRSTIRAAERNAHDKIARHNQENP